MNGSDSECSSGCESGWTVYLEHSFLPPNPSRRGKCFLGYESGYLDNHSSERTKEEEDLSMVSDASSGPPHFHETHFEDDNGSFYSAPKALAFAKNNGKRQKVKEDLSKYDDSFLDDTASSPLFNFTVKNCVKQSSIESSLDFSQGFSATDLLEDRRRLQSHFDLLHSSLSGSRLQKKQLG